MKHIASQIKDRLIFICWADLQRKGQMITNMVRYVHSENRYTGEMSCPCGPLTSASLLFWQPAEWTHALSRETASVCDGLPIPSHPHDLAVRATAPGGPGPRTPAGQRSCRLLRHVHFSQALLARPPGPQCGAALKKLTRRGA